jgi:hypothetical protein
MESSAPWWFEPTADVSSPAPVSRIVGTLGSVLLSRSRSASPSRRVSQSSSKQSQRSTPILASAASPESNECAWISASSFSKRSMARRSTSSSSTRNTRIVLEDPGSARMVAISRGETQTGGHASCVLGFASLAKRSSRR